MITQVYVEDMDFNAEFDKAIEEAAISTQNKIKAENDLARIKGEQEQIVAQAKGQAEALVTKAQSEAQAKLLIAEAEAKSLGLQRMEIDSNVLRLREIEVEMERVKHWNGNVPTVTMGNTPTLWQMPAQLLEKTAEAQP